MGFVCFRSCTAKNTRPAGVSAQAGAGSAARAFWRALALLVGVFLVGCGANFEARKSHAPTGFQARAVTVREKQNPSSPGSQADLPINPVKKLSSTVIDDDPSATQTEEGAPSRPIEGELVRQPSDGLPATPSAGPTGDPTVAPSGQSSGQSGSSAAPIILHGPSSASKPRPDPSVSPDLAEPCQDSDPGRKRVCELVNLERARYGLKPLSLSKKLMLIAIVFAHDMKKRRYFSHVSPDGLTMPDRFHQAELKFHVAGENIAEGQQEPEEVVTDWMNSPGHRRNILNAKFGRLGVARVENIWVQDFSD